ncbi:MAG: hypothetical protein GY719_06450 [bacterium]|nr:hypothetical protein [bacterium]
MKVFLEAAADAAALEFDAVADVEAFFSQVKEQTGFFIQLEVELKQYRKLTFTTVAAPKFDFEFEAEVIQVIPGPAGFGTAFQLCWKPGKSEELDRKLKGRAAVEDPSVSSPQFKIRNMNPNERFRLATKATRTERQILLRDTSPQVLLGLLAHPRLETKEALELVKSTHATGAMMERVAQNRKWMSNPEVQLAIVKSTKTSPPLAVKLLDNLRVGDLRMLAKSSSIREQVKRAALRVYLKRTGQRK